MQLEPNCFGLEIIHLLVFSNFYGFVNILMYLIRLTMCSHKNSHNVTYADKNLLKLIFISIVRWKTTNFWRLTGIQEFFSLLFLCWFSAVISFHFENFCLMQFESKKITNAYLNTKICIWTYCNYDAIVCWKILHLKISLDISSFSFFKSD